MVRNEIQLKVGALYRIYSNRVENRREKGIAMCALALDTQVELPR